MKKLNLIAASALLIALTAGTAQATEIRYIMPTAAGKKDGTSWENAAAMGQLPALVAAVGAGGKILVRADAGIYNVNGGLSIKAGGTPAAPVTITGANAAGKPMLAQISGTRKAYNIDTATTNLGNTIFSPEGSNLIIENMRIDNAQHAFSIKANIKNLTVRNIMSNNVRHFMRVYRTMQDLVIKNVKVIGYTKGVVWLEGDTSNVLMEDVFGNSLKQAGDPFTMGVHMDDSVHDVVLRRVTMKNSLHIPKEGNSYVNGDGFATERGNYNIRFEDTLAEGNSDGGYDLKSSKTVLLRAHALNNKLNYRLWNTDHVIQDSVGLHPKKAQINMAKDAKARFVNTQLASNLTNQSVILGEPGSQVTFDNVKLAKLAATPVRLGGQALVGTPVMITEMPALPNVPEPNPMAVDVPVVPEKPKMTVIDFSSPAAQFFRGTSAAEMILIDQAGNNGADSVASFGAEDLVALTQKLHDGNNDGIIDFATRVLKVKGPNDAKNTLAMSGVKRLMYLGSKVMNGRTLHLYTPQQGKKLSDFAL